MKTFRKIGILTSGGDAPGMNACVNAAVHRAKKLNIEMIGINEGYAGLIRGDLVNLTNQNTSNIISESGTILYSSRCPEFKTEEGMQKAVKTCRDNQIDALICIGGDGTFRGATDMTFHGIPSIGIPGTIDNDITATDYTIGFDTAINTSTYLIDHIRDTSESLSRCGIVEVMGNGCGQIALYAAIASGAVACGIPEIPFSEEEAVASVLRHRAEGKRGMIVTISESLKTADGTPVGESLRQKLLAAGIDTKFCRFAHIVRGGAPTVRDRATAARMADFAIECLVSGKSNLVVCENDGKIEGLDIAYALIADRMYKNKLKPGDLDNFTEEQIAAMKALCAKRRANIENLYATACNLAI